MPQIRKADDEHTSGGTALLQDPQDGSAGKRRARVHREGIDHELVLSGWSGPFSQILQPA